MVNPALLASVDALPLDEQIEFVEHINSNLSARTRASETDKELIDDRASDTDPTHWSSIGDFDSRIRARLA